MLLRALFVAHCPLPPARPRAVQGFVSGSIPGALKHRDMLHPSDAHRLPGQKFGTTF